MNEIIKKLYEIEETAGDIMKNAQLQKEQLQKQMEELQQEFVLQQEETLKKRLEIKALEWNQYAEYEILQLDRKYQKQMTALDCTYDGHFQDLATEIFNRIIEV